MTKGKRYRLAELLCAAAMIGFIVLWSLSLAGGTDKSAAELAAAVTEGMDEAVMTRKTARKAAETFHLPPDLAEDLAFYANDSVMDVSELLIVKLRDRADAPLVREAIEKRVEDQKNLYKNYAPEQYALLDRCRIAVNGNTVFYCTADNADSLYNLFKNKLN